MIKWIRNIVIIIVALLVFVFFFAGKGIFDSWLPIVEVKNAILLEISSGENKVQKMDNGGYITRKDAKDQFIERMLADGYALTAVEEDGYTFYSEKEGLTLHYGTREFLGYLVYEEKSTVTEQNAGTVSAD